MNVSVVLPDRLWLGPAPRAADLEHLKTLGITAILSMIHPSDPYEVPEAIRSSFAWACLPVRDSYLGGLPTCEDLSQGVETMRQWGAAGHRIYLHCLEGKGRSPLLAMAYLVGAHGERLTSSIARVKHASDLADPNVFQLKVLCDYVIQALDLQEPIPLLTPEERAAMNPEQSSPTLFDRFAGSILGLAVGDALGTTLEFKQPGTFQPLLDMVGKGPFGLERGQWTDDTSMALCLAESLLVCGGFDARDQMERYVRWYRTGHWSSTGACFDIGNTVREALQAFEQTRDPLSGSSHPGKAGNGSLMRLAPVPLYYHRQPATALELAADSSRTTHGARTAVDACRYYAALTLGALQGHPKDDLLASLYTPVPGALDDLGPEIREVAEGSFKQKAPPAIRGTGYVVQSLEAALWAFYTTDTFAAGALAAVNLGEDADTTGAIYGQLAGAYYGAQAIPEDWRTALARRPEIDELIARLFEASTSLEASSAGLLSTP